jgi:uncharacterized protein
LSNHLDRPLGQNVTRKISKQRLTFGRLTAAFFGAAVLAGSAVFALQRENFRDAALQAGAVEVDAPAAVSSAAALETPAVAPPVGADPLVASKDAAGAKTGAGPKIIKVKPDPGDITGSVMVRDPSKLTQDPKMAHVPDPELAEKTASGLLPVRAADGRRPLDVYARPWSGARGAKVAIIIGGLGISQTSTQRAIRALPPEITLAFAPQGNSLSRWAQEARRGGHEILLQIPMEPFDYPNVNPGRGTLLADADPAQNLAELRRSMGRFTNYAGVVNYMGARFTSETAAFQPIIREITGRGLLFVDDGTSARSQTVSLSESAKGAYAMGDLVIDDVQDKEAILKKLDQLEASARASGSAIATGTAFDTTVEAVAAWAEAAKKRGVEIVGVSAVAHDPEK